MDAIVTGIIIFFLTFGAALLGIWMRTLLPKHHLDEASKDTIKMSIGLIATMAALILGLVTASAKTSYDAVDVAVKQSAIELLALDSLLARYGSDTGEIRIGLKSIVKARIDGIWQLKPMQPNVGSSTVAAPGMTREGIASAIRHLKTNDDAQVFMKGHALELTEKLMETNWLNSIGIDKSIPTAFLVAIVFWLMIVFWSFGLFSPLHTTVVVVLLVCTLSVASTIFLVMEMDTPFSGVLMIPPDSLVYAYDHLGQ